MFPPRVRKHLLGSDGNGVGDGGGGETEGGEGESGAEGRHRSCSPRQFFLDNESEQKRESSAPSRRCCEAMESAEEEGGTYEERDVGGGEGAEIRGVLPSGRTNPFD